MTFRVSEGEKVRLKRDEHRDIQAQTDEQKERGLATKCEDGQADGETEEQNSKRGIQKYRM